MRKEKLKNSCRSISNNLVVAGIIATFFSQVPFITAFIVMIIGTLFVNYGVKL